MGMMEIEMENLMEMEVENLMEMEIEMYSNIYDILAYMY